MKKNGFSGTVYYMAKEHEGVYNHTWSTMDHMSTRCCARKLREAKANGHKCYVGYLTGELNWDGVFKITWVEY